MRKIYLLLLFATLALMSCKNYLDLKPYGKVIPKTAEEYSAMLHTILNDIENGNEAYIIENESVSIDNETVIDNLDANIYSQGNLPNYLGDIAAKRSSAYTKIYEQIRTCNIVIDGLINDNTTLAKKVIATAKAMRGAYNFQLLRSFCQPVVNGVYPEEGIVIVDHFDMEARPIRSSYEASIRFIESDLNSAILNGHEDPVYMFTSDVARAYLARLYFWVGNWSNAITTSKELLGKYPLIKGAAYTEMINSFACKGNTILKSRVNGLTNDGNTGDNITILKPRPVNKKFIDLFIEGERDIRFVTFFNKFREITKRPCGRVRSAEFALIIAESYYHLGETNNAIDAINNLRRNRITDYIDITSSTIPKQPSGNVIVSDARGKMLTPLIELILNERRKELMAESDRLFELKRNGRPETWISMHGLAYKCEKFMYTFAIPDSDIVLVNGMKQNPGYDVYKD